jgi:uncharacterized protein (DUF1697 family)
MAARSKQAQQYIAFLRAINVGGHTVKMDHLRTLFEQLEVDDVATFIASGNVIFTTSSGTARTLEQRIESHLATSLGYDVATFLRTPTAVNDIAAYDPFPDVTWQDAGYSLYVMFLQSPPAAAAARAAAALSNDVDTLRVHGRELYWLSAKTLGQSSLTGAQLERALGQPGTMRNITTVRRLAAKYGAAD